jgi:hypothetical protein
MSRVAPCGKTLGHGEACCEGWMCDACTYITGMEEVLSDVRALLHEVREFTDLIMGSPPSTEIKGAIESRAMYIGHHPFVLNPNNARGKAS